jgi:hypothetical protein
MRLILHEILIQCSATLHYGKFYLLNTKKSPTRDTYKMSLHCPETNNKLFGGKIVKSLPSSIEKGKQLI